MIRDTLKMNNHHSFRSICRKNQCIFTCFFVEVFDNSYIRFLFTTMTNAQLSTCFTAIQFNSCITIVLLSNTLGEQHYRRKKTVTICESIETCVANSFHFIQQFNIWTIQFSEYIDTPILNEIMEIEKLEE